MPVTAQDGLKPERFAALWAGCETGNTNEAEAVAKFRALRRMVAAENCRIVDAMGRADVMHALDAQLEPVREESPELKAAFLQVTQLAELAKARQEAIDALEKKLAARPMTVHMPSQPRASDSGRFTETLVAALSVVAVALMLAALVQAVE